MIALRANASGDAVTTRTATPSVDGGVGASFALMAPLVSYRPLASFGSYYLGVGSISNSLSLSLLHTPFTTTPS